MTATLTKDVEPEPDAAPPGKAAPGHAGLNPTGYGPEQDDPQPEPDPPGEPGTNPTGHDYTLGIPDVAIVASGSAEQDTTLNSGNDVQIDDCTGQITLHDGAALDGHVTMSMPDFNTAGDTIEVTWSVDGKNLVGTYPSSGEEFSLMPHQYGTGTNHWDTDDQVTPGTYKADTEIHGPDDAVLVTAHWTLTIDPDAAPVAPAQQTGGTS